MIKKVALSLALASSLAVSGMAQAQPMGYGGAGGPLGMTTTEFVFFSAFVVGGTFLVADRVDSRKKATSP